MLHILKLYTSISSLPLMAFQPDSLLWTVQLFPGSFFIESQLGSRYKLLKVTWLLASLSHIATNDQALNQGQETSDSPAVAGLQHSPAPARMDNGQDDGSSSPTSEGPQAPHLCSRWTEDADVEQA